MAPPNRATSPTGMLWAHQLKREHGILLEKMKKLEGEITKVETTAKSAKNATASYDIGAIANQVKALTEDGGSKAIEQMRKEVMERLENIDAEMEAITLKVAAIDQDSAKVEEERKRAFNNEKALLKRVKEVEEHLNEYEKNLNRIGDQVNERQMDVIRAQLADLLDQVKEEGAERETFRDSLLVLEQVTQELKEDNQKLAKEIKEMGKKPAPVAPMMPPAMTAPKLGSTSNALPMAQGKQKASAEKMPPSGAQQSRKRNSGTACRACRKSHLRCTHGNNDVDAEEQGEEEEEIAMPASEPAPNRPAVTDNKSKPPQPQPKTARTAKAIKQEALEAQDRQPKSRAPAARGLQREIQQLKAASQLVKKEPSTQRAAQNQVVASGRGWVTFERTPSDDQVAPAASSPQDIAAGFTAAERVKRGRGRPKKATQDQPPPPPPVPAPKRGRGRPPKNPSQTTTQAAQTQANTPKRGRGRPRKEVSQLLNVIETPRRGPGRPRKNVAPAQPAPPAREVKQEYIERQQPLREIKPAQTTEAPAAKAAPIKKEPGREKKSSALEALQQKRGLARSSSGLSSAPSSPKKRKAAEQPAMQPRPKRRTIEQDDDEEED
ncbi:hypothetical protein PRZ48_009442 [Zasmidium cellare]|uniref:Uncharacterized protein n=1 Tax=Zasmidium cellare TaxID=395010 RepID=A0ABR0EBS8_ZASCE|nr:hypothetical protein PRZ48_009442 [Zasmidium cellare]